MKSQFLSKILTLIIAFPLGMVLYFCFRQKGFLILAVGTSFYVAVTMIYKRGIHFMFWVYALLLLLLQICIISVLNFPPPKGSPLFIVISISFIDWMFIYALLKKITEFLKKKEK